LITSHDYLTWIVNGCLEVGLLVLPSVSEYRVIIVVVFGYLQVMLE